MLESSNGLEYNKPNIKIFNFNHNITLELTLTKLYYMYNGLTKSDCKLIALLYLSSQRCRSFVHDAFPVYFSYIHKDMDDYEYNVESTFGQLLYDIDTFNFIKIGVTESELDALIVEYDEFIETEMQGWIKWAFNKHTDDKTPVHLLRYIVGNSLI